MTLSFSSDQRRMLDDPAFVPMWVAEFELGPYAHLRVLDYAEGSTDDVTLTVTWSGGSTTRTYTEGTDFSATTDDSTTATNIAAAINLDSAITDRVSAYTRGEMVVVHGKAGDDRIQNSTEADELEFGTTDANAWYVQFGPVNRDYVLCSHGFKPYDSTEANLVYIDEILDVSNIAAEIDPIERNFSIGDIEITIDDTNQRSVWRKLHKSCFPIGKRVTLSIAGVGYDIDDKIPVGVYLIQDVKPSPGVIKIRCGEVTAAIHNVPYNPTPAPVKGIYITDGSSLSGRGATLTVGYENADGSYEVTFTEGVDFSSGADPVPTIRAILALVNADSSLAPHVCMAYNGLSGADATGWLFPVPYIGESASDPSNRPQRLVLDWNGEGTYAYVLEASGIADPDGIYVSPGPPSVMNMHPISVLRDLYRAAGFKATTGINEASFARASYTDISHWGITAAPSWVHYHSGDNAGENAFGSDQDSLDIQDEVSRLCQGGVVVDENGAVKFIRRDTSASSTRTLGSDDIDELVIDEFFDTAISKVTVYGEGEGSGNKIALITIEDTLASATQSFAAKTNAQSKSFSSKLIGNISLIEKTGFDDTDTSLVVIGAVPNAFCGSRPASTGTAGSQTATDQLSDPTRVGYFLIWDQFTDSREYVKVTSGDAFGNNRWADPGIPVTDIGVVAENVDTYPSGVPATQRFFRHHFNMSYTVERGQYGTDAIDWEARAGDVYVTDVTIALAIAEHYLSFAHGAPMMSFRTPLRHWDLQLGDVIKLECPYYLDTYEDGLLTSGDNNTTWEIISKELEFPFVRFKVARLSRDFNPLEAWHYIYPPIDLVHSLDPPDDPVTDNALATVTDAAYTTVYRG